MGIQKTSFCALLAMAVCSVTTAIRADVATTGDVSPDPTTADNNTDVYVGNTADGSVTLNNGAALVSNTVTLGNLAGTNGTVTVTGPGSSWGGDNCTFFVGNSGNGTLNITDGGAVHATTFVGYNPGADGHVVVAGPGASLGDGVYLGYDGAGTLTVSNGGTVSGYGYLGMDEGSSGSVTIDGPGSAWTQGIGGIYVGNDGNGALALTNGATAFSDSGYIGFGLNAPGVGTVTIDGAGSQWTGMTGGLYVGLFSSGTLTLSNGGRVDSDSGYVGGSGTGSIGKVSIDGPGSAWTGNLGGVYVGDDSAGIISVTNGGTLESEGGYIGFNAGGTIIVDGPASRWNNTDILDLSTNATLSISHGGHVTAAYLTLDNPSALLTMSVGDGSSLDLGAGNVTNTGTIRLAAAPSAATGVYTPINAAAGATWGTVQSLGGTWNPATATFTISTPATGNAGAPIHLDLSQQQRAIATDPATGKSVIASFLAASSATPLDFTATPLTADQAVSLTLTSNQTLLAGWTFTAAGYTEGDPVYLSLDIGPGFNLANLSTWHYDGAAWTLYTPADLTYDGQFASFTVNGFSGYALTVPEPASLSALTLGSLALLASRRRRNHPVT